MDEEFDFLKKETPAELKRATRLRRIKQAFYAGLFYIIGTTAINTIDFGYSTYRSNETLRRHGVKDQQVIDLGELGSLETFINPLRKWDDKLAFNDSNMENQARLAQVENSLNGKEEYSDDQVADMVLSGMASDEDMSRQLHKFNNIKESIDNILGNFHDYSRLMFRTTDMSSLQKISDQAGIVNNNIATRADDLRKFYFISLLGAHLGKEYSLSPEILMSIPWAETDMDMLATGRFNFLDTGFAQFQPETAIHLISNMTNPGKPFYYSIEFDSLMDWDSYIPKLEDAKDKIAFLNRLEQSNLSIEERIEQLYDILDGRERNGRVPVFTFDARDNYNFTTLSYTSSLPPLEEIDELKDIKARQDIIIIEHPELAEAHQVYKEIFRWDVQMMMEMTYIKEVFAYNKSSDGTIYPRRDFWRPVQDYADNGEGIDLTSATTFFLYAAYIRGPGVLSSFNKKLKDANYNPSRIQGSYPDLHAARHAPRLGQRYTQIRRLKEEGFFAFKEKEQIRRLWEDNPNLQHLNIDHVETSVKLANDVESRPLEEIAKQYLAR